MFTEELKKRNLPPLKSKAEMLEIMLSEEYGHLPPVPSKISWESFSLGIGTFCTGRATIQGINCKCEINGKEFVFPFKASIPNGNGPHPFFVMINFRPDVPDRYLPIEEIIENGYAVLSFCYEDISLDKNEFESGLSGVLYENGKRGENDCGKISMWAWASQRILDWAETQPQLDMSRAMVCGHSRL